MVIPNASGTDVKEIVRSGNVYRLTVFSDEGRWFWIVTKAPGPVGSPVFGIVHASGEATDAETAWLLARAAVPSGGKRSKRRDHPWLRVADDR